ncbi:MAG: hypothetical protein FWG79_03250 [Bacteroidales bacterium]|nr:hypothetical protein [Bacteroidales bacterium]
MKTFFKPLLQLLLVVFCVALSLSGCKKKDFYLQNDPELSVSVSHISIPMTGGSYSIDVKSTRRWIIDANSDNKDWFGITPTSLRGENDGRINITAMPNDWGERRLTLTIETAGGLSQQVYIVQEGFNSRLLLRETFGVGATGNPWAGDYDGYRRENHEGVGGAESVTYSGNNVSIRSTGVSPSPEFSGGNNAFFAAAGGTLNVADIELFQSRRLLISFAINEPSSVLAVDYTLDDGTTWVPVPFTKATQGWERIFAEVELEGSIPNEMTLRFISNGEIRLDDLRIEGVDGLPGEANRLSLSPSILNDVSSAGGPEVINVSSNSEWEVISNVPWLTVNPAAGINDGDFEVSIAANSIPEVRSGTVTVRTTGEGNIVTRTLTVNQQPDASSFIWGENMGLTPVSSNTLVASYSGWSKEGSSGSTVSYVASGGTVDIRSNYPQGTANGTYSGATPQNNMLFAATTGAVLTVSGIDPGERKYFSLSFGLSSPSANMTVDYSIDGTTWSPISLSIKNTTNWGLINAEFEIPTTTTTLSLRFTATSSDFGVRLDDIRLFGSEQPIPQLIVSPSVLEVSRDGGTRNISIISNGDWVVSKGSETWFTLGATSGNGNQTLNVNIDANDVTQIRSATITVMSADGNITRTVTINQEPALPANLLARWVFPTEPDLSNVTASEGNGTIAASSNRALTWHSEGTIRATAGWNVTDAAWLITIPLDKDISGEVTVDLRGYGSNTGPRDFKLQASSDNATWTDGGTYQLANVAFTHDNAKKTVKVTLPATIPSGGTLYLRLITVGENGGTGITGNPTASGGVSRIGDITVAAD